MIDQYIKWFTSLHCSKRDGHRAPHKPIMLLSVIDLIESGHLTENAIRLDNTLKERFHLLWEHYIRENDIYKPNAATPYDRMSSEPFWKFSSIIHSQATLHDELWDDLQKHETRNILRKTLKETYLKEWQKEPYKTNLDIQNMKATDADQEIQKLKDVISYLKSQGYPVPQQMLDKLAAHNNEKLHEEVFNMINTLAEDLVWQYKDHSISIHHKDGAINVVVDGFPKPLLSPIGPFRTRKTHLRIVFDDGRVMENSKAITTLVEFINYVGPEKARTVGIVHAGVELISDRLIPESKQKPLNNGYYIYTKTHNEVKAEDIKKIAEALGIKLTVDILTTETIYDY